MVTDVICGMKVKEKSAIFEEFGGNKFYFCSEGCRQEFRKNPIKYSR